LRPAIRTDWHNREKVMSTRSRRDALRAALAVSAAGTLGASAGADETKPARVVQNGRLQQSACRWCYGKIPLEEFCAAAKAIGLVGIDLVGPNDFETLKKYGLVSTMVPSNPLTNGPCDPKFMESSLKAMVSAIEATSKEGWRNVICMSGNARGIDPKAGMDNCVKVLKEAAPIAEKANVILNMELLNSKVDHPDYMCDNSKWGVELVKRVGSPNFKLLYDIYHMQIMEGDVIRTIQQNHEYYGHYHTGGNPGRNELDESQELNYKAIAKAIVDTGFKGYFAHEFIPKRDPLTSLREAVALCDV
jgi:hydroxypyruvate isomerase